ncbi:MAG: GNAT family N-acetyltransferase [Ignavibacteria bacterium]|jgi:GNAT superfamily N-acetyltransferase
MIREYSQTDFERCKGIINLVWEFDSRFSPNQLSELFKNIYVGNSLSESNFTKVIEENGIVQGFIFGKSGNRNLYKTEYSGFLGRLKVSYDLCTVKGISLKRKMNYIKMINEHEVNRRRIEPNRENEVNLFAVNPNTQGKGFGKLLMNSFIDFCKEKNVTRITLETDKECNTGFYDYFGFKVKGEFYSPLLKEYSGKSGMSFIYELDL